MDCYQLHIDLQLNFQRSSEFIEGSFDTMAGKPIFLRETPMVRALPLVVISLLCVSSVRADLLPPGQKPVEHVLRIENTKEYPDHVFFIYPRDINRGLPGNTSVRVGDNGEGSMAGNPLARRNGAFLYAVPRSLMDKEKTPREEWFESHRSGRGPAQAHRHALPDRDQGRPEADAAER
jgi:hypothetical protein